MILLWRMKFHFLSYFTPLTPHFFPHPFLSAPSIPIFILTPSPHSHFLLMFLFSSLNPLTSPPPSLLFSLVNNSTAHMSGKGGGSGGQMNHKDGELKTSPRLHYRASRICSHKTVCVLFLLRSSTNVNTTFTCRSGRRRMGVGWGI